MTEQNPKQEREHLVTPGHTCESHDAEFTVTVQTFIVTLSF